MVVEMIKKEDYQKVEHSTGNPVDFCKMFKVCGNCDFMNIEQTCFGNYVFVCNNGKSQKVYEDVKRSTPACTEWKMLVEK